MSSSDTHPTVGMVRSVAGRPMRKRVMIAIPAFLLATAFTFSGAPMAMAAPAVANDGIASFWEPDECRGNQPGVCPYGYPVNQQAVQPHRSPDHQIAPNRSSSPQR
jgi:hypothetical protein